MLCPACQQPNDPIAKFCHQCGQPLGRSCPTCQQPVGAEARFCSQCGCKLALSDTASPAPASKDRLDRLQSYLPRHLAEKILANRGRLEGERKLVTVVFADIVGYSTLSEHLPEETLFALMDDLYELFIHEMHRYEGTVNELTGDGIVAFFGAPLAVEQAPLRAVRAALALQAAIAQRSASLEHEHDFRLQMRVGINTGPVIVGTVGNNLRMDYKAVGNTVTLAARMEQSAVPETVQITAQTYRLVAGYVECDDLGLIRIKGATAPVQAYRVTGEREVRARIDVARQRGFTRLVARERELEQLCRCFELAKNGSGQAVSIIGDAGLGKSRLLYECRRALADEALTWLEGRCSPYATAVAYLPIVEMLRQYFEIDASDSDADLAHKVRVGLGALSPDLETMAPYLLRLLSSNADVGMPASMSPDAVKYRIFDTLRLLMLENSEQRPVVLAIEDLHWMDKTTEEFVNFLLDHIAGSRVLLILTYRPDFDPAWSRKSYHSAMNLTRLVQSDSSQMLQAVLGALRVQHELAELVLHKAEGVPFFIEELAQSLQESGAIEQRDGEWRLRSVDLAALPDSVEEVLMARIDRLPEGAKQVLQIGAVIGREVSWDLLQAVAGLAGEELSAHLHALTDAELFYERRLASQTTYIFKHAFTQEAAYRSLLSVRRRELHHRVALALETLFAERLEEHDGQLAHHFFEADQFDELDNVIAYAKRAGDRRMALPAYAEAARYYQMALHALERQEPVDEGQRCFLLLALGKAQRIVGEFHQALDTLQRAADSARQLETPVALAHIVLEVATTTEHGELPTKPTIPLFEEALLKLGDGDSALRASVLGSLARSLHFAGSQQQTAMYAQQAVAMARRIQDVEALINSLRCLIMILSKPEETEDRLECATEMLRLTQDVGNNEMALIAHFRRIECLLELGNIEAVDAEIAMSSQINEVMLMPATFSGIAGFRAMRALMEGRFDEAEQLALHTLEITQRTQSTQGEGAFGLRMFSLRREQGRLKELESAVRYFVEQHGVASTWRPGLALIYSELGREQEARAEFDYLARHDFTDLPRDALWVGCLTYLIEVGVFLNDTARAATLYDLLLPYAGRTIVLGGSVVCYGAASHYLGMLAATLAHWQEAEQHFEAALAMNADMGARPWLAHTQHQYAVMRLARNQPSDAEKAESLLKEALSTALELGMRTLAERVIARLEQKATPSPVAQAQPTDLSQREVEVLRLIAAGKSNREIADALYISLHTVASHVSHILAKTNAANRTEAAAYAMRHGLLPHS